MNRPTNNKSNHRSAFTLLELLAVITIISILLALILPAIGGAMRNARNAEVSAEFQQLGSAIQAFSADNGGLHPWSEIVLTEDWSTTAWRPQSRTRIRRLWPQFNFTPRDASNNPIRFDFNGDGAFTGDTTGTVSGLGQGEILVTASEALVFFLGGMRRPGANAVVGFSKNPVNPFTLAGENRTPVYHEFDPAQLVDTDNDGMLEYVDPLAGQTTPLLYVCSNNGQGYSKSNGSLNYYVQGDGTTPWSKDSFQIISPGEDGEFGFEPAINGSAPLGIPQPYSDDFDVPQQQADNIASFAPGGTLGK